MKTNELPVIQKTYDLIKWYIPIINRLPRIHKFAIGDRITKFLYEMLEDLIIARYTRDKILILEKLLFPILLLIIVEFEMGFLPHLSLLLKL